jgi:hypothetical protein
MEDNISYRDSLRANGAFTMPSIEITQCQIEILDIKKASQDIVRIISKAHNDFIDRVKTTEGFNKYLLEQEKFAYEKLIKMLACIELMDYIRAKEMADEEIEKGNEGGFTNFDKDIYLHIQEYCEKYI